MITQERVRELFDYRNDGNLIRKVKTTNRVQIGDIAGTLREDGKYGVHTQGRIYLLHRLIYLYHHGHMPKFIDHIEGLSNRIENLRACTIQENARNSRKHKDGSSRYKGVSWDKSRNKWQSRAAVNAKTIHIGRFKLEIDAAEAYNKFAKENFGEFARLNVI